MTPRSVLLLAAALLLNLGVAHAQICYPGLVQPVATNSKCWQSQNGNITGSPIVLANCTGSVDQYFNYFNNTVTMYGGAMCLDVTDGVDKDGTKLQISQCRSGDPNQQWLMITEVLPDSSPIIFDWINHEKCLDLTHGSQANGNQIQIWHCNDNNNNQKWTATNTP